MIYNKYIKTQFQTWHFLTNKEHCIDCTQPLKQRRLSISIHNSSLFLSGVCVLLVQWRTKVKIMKMNFACHVLFLHSFFSSFNYFVCLKCYWNCCSFIWVVAFFFLSFGLKLCFVCFFFSFSFWLSTDDVWFFFFKKRKAILLGLFSHRFLPGFIPVNMFRR